MLPDKFLKNLINLFGDNDFMLRIKMVSAIGRDYQNRLQLKVTAGVQTIQPNLIIIRHF